MADLLTHVIPRSVWYGWGDPTEAKPLSAGAWSALEKELGVSPRRVPNLPVPIEDVRLPDSRLTDDQRSAVAAVVGISVAQQWTPIVDPWVAAGGVVLGAIVGLVAGGFPARRAARIEPVTALRGGH